MGYSENFTNSNIKYLREKQRISQLELAEALNIDQSTLAKWENNTRQITLEWSIKIANYFNIDVGDFISKNLKNEIFSDEATNSRQILFDKTKDLLSEDDWATIEFIMNKTISNYEKNKNNE